MSVRSLHQLAGQGQEWLEEGSAPFSPLPLPVHAALPNPTAAP